MILPDVTKQIFYLTINVNYVWHKKDLMQMYFFYSYFKEVKLMNKGSFALLIAEKLPSYFSLNSG